MTSLWLSCTNGSITQLMPGHQGLFQAQSCNIRWVRKTYGSARLSNKGRKFSSGHEWMSSGTTFCVVHYYYQKSTGGLMTMMSCHLHQSGWEEGSIFSFERRKGAKRRSWRIFDMSDPSSVHLRLSNTRLRPVLSCVISSSLQLLVFCVHESFFIFSFFDQDVVSGMVPAASSRIKRKKKNF